MIWKNDQQNERYIPVLGVDLRCRFDVAGPPFDIPIHTIQIQVNMQHIIAKLAYRTRSNQTPKTKQNLDFSRIGEMKIKNKNKNHLNVGLNEKWRK